MENDMKLSYGSYPAHSQHYTKVFSYSQFPLNSLLGSTLDFLRVTLELSEKTKAYSSNIYNFSEHDARKAFFVKVSDALNWFYLSYAFPIFAHWLENHDLIPTPYRLLTSQQYAHLENFKHLTGPLLAPRLISRLKLHLIFDVWVCFESSLEPIFNAYLNDDEKNSPKMTRYNKTKTLLNNFIETINVDLRLNSSITYDLIPKIEKSGTIDDSGKVTQALKKLVSNLEDNLIPEYLHLGGKWDSLFKRIGPQYSLIARARHNLAGITLTPAQEKKIINLDKEFLKMMNAVRNSTHYNAVPLKDAKFVTRLGTFSLSAGVPLNFIYEPFLIKAVDELVEIFYTIVCCIHHFNESVIWEPSSNQELKALVERDMGRLKNRPSVLQVFKLFLATHPITQEYAMYLSRKNRRSIRNSLQYLIQEKIITEITGRKRNKVYVYPEYLKIRNKHPGFFE